MQLTPAPFWCLVVRPSSLGKLLPSFQTAPVVPYSSASQKMMSFGENLPILKLGPLFGFPIAPKPQPNRS
ncbi:MAG: hypothetical protein JWP03_4286 [Phycisphaerales bacterium]|nr:hypothetical protein [Phycisphaerales bacterium]